MTTKAEIETIYIECLRLVFTDPQTWRVGDEKIRSIEALVDVAKIITSESIKALNAMYVDHCEPPQSGKKYRAYIERKRRLNGDPP